MLKDHVDPRQGGRIGEEQVEATCKRLQRKNFTSASIDIMCISKRFVANGKSDTQTIILKLEAEF